MNNYIRELLEVCGLPFDEVSRQYKVISIGGKMIYVSNFQRIIDYTTDRIVLKISRNTLEIVGKRMQIQQINKNEIVIQGEICSFSQGVNNENKK